jgi:hypothetical protein
MKNVVFWDINSVHTSQETHYVSVTASNQLMLLSLYRVGSVPNNMTRVRIGYQIYSLWRFTAAHITITENIYSTGGFLNPTGVTALH